MNRRTFLSSALCLSTGIYGKNYIYAQKAPEIKGLIQTVNGRIKASTLGNTLPHEHIMVDFIGASEVSPLRYDAREVYQRALPFLNEITARGCKAFFDCTPAFLGRDVKILQQLSRASGLHIITNTGFYGARDNAFIPWNLMRKDSNQLAAMWIKEARNGIDGTNILPGFIKIGVDKGSLSAFHASLAEAAALTHLKTGLTIASHTGLAEAAYQQVEILKKNKVRPEAFIWVHAQEEKDNQHHIALAKQGVWIEFDGISEKIESIEMHMKHLSEMKSANLLHKVLISQDSGWYNVGEPNGGNFKNFNAIYDIFLPAMLKNQFSESEIDLLMVQNPAKAFSIEVKKIK
ncbi:MAG: phosphotriesterase [Cyclobacteriaceae bacterium]|nr:phosphotriesterase [Cyclobacteriaceae bacterium]